MATPSTSETVFGRQGQANNLQHLKRAFSDILRSNYTVLQDIVKEEETLREWAGQLRQAGIITADIAHNPTYDDIINSFTAKLPLLATITNIKAHCQQFIYTLSKLGGPATLFTDTLREEWRTAAIEIIGYNHFMGADHRHYTKDQKQDILKYAEGHSMDDIKEYCEKIYWRNPVPSTIKKWQTLREKGIEETDDPQPPPVSQPTATDKGINKPDTARQEDRAQPIILQVITGDHNQGYNQHGEQRQQDNNVTERNCCSKLSKPTKRCIAFMITLAGLATAIITLVTTLLITLSGSGSGSNNSTA